jgi:hypothetical protein
MDQLSWQVATLVAHRQQHHHDFESWCLISEIAPEIGRNVERLGTRASLEEITLYSRALGFDIGINIVADEPQTRKLAISCETCGETPVLHKQRHTGTYDKCFDEKIVDLVEALYSVGIKVIDAGQGHTDGRRGGDARLTLSSVIERAVTSQNVLVCVALCVPQLVPGVVECRGTHSLAIRTLTLQLLSGSRTATSRLSPA